LFHRVIVEKKCDALHCIVGGEKEMGNCSMYNYMII
jgi:hypothetical protein